MGFIFRARLDRVEHGLDVGDGDLLGRRNVEGPDRKLQLHLAADDLGAPRVLAVDDAPGVGLSAVEQVRFAPGQPGHRHGV